MKALQFLLRNSLPGILIIYCELCLNSVLKVPFTVIRFQDLGEKLQASTTNPEDVNSSQGVE
jgi:hypothetical protein